MASFFHVHVMPSPGVSQEAIEKKLSSALDWFRYSVGTYVIYTTSDVDKWYERLSPLVKPGGRVFICELDVDNRQGWMPKAFWQWLRKHDEGTA